MKSPRNKRFFSVFIIAIVLPILSIQKTYAQNSVDWAAVHTKTMEAIDALYSLNFDGAEKKCAETIALAPSDPRGHFFRAMIHYYRYTLVTNSEPDYHKFVAHTKRVAEVCDKILESRENDSKALFYKGGIIGYRGLIKFNKGDHSGAFWDGKEALSNLEDALEHDPNNADIQMGFGLFNYLISQAPSTIKPMLKVVGLEGDKYKGLRQLENAAKNGLYCKNEAKRWLSTFYNWEELYNRSASMYKSILTEYPQNTWIRLGYINLLVNSLRNPDGGIEQTKEMEKFAKHDFKKPLSRAYLLCGAAHFFKLEYENAIQCYNKCITLNIDSNHMQNAYWSIGRTMEIMGNRKDGWNYYVKSEYDKKEYQTPLTEDDIVLIRFENLFRAGKYSSVTAMENEIKDRKWNDDDKGRALYSLGRSYHELGQFLQAERVFSLITSLKPNENTWLPPYALYRLGLTYAANKKENSALEVFTKAREYENYSSEEYLKKLIMKEQHKLRKKS